MTGGFSKAVGRLRWGSRASGYEDRVLFDLVYYDGVSLATDLRLLWRTVGAVLGRTGQ